MILLVDLCHRENSLGYEEFILPIQRIAGQSVFPVRAAHYSRLKEGDVKSARGIILCGTPLADNQFISDARDLSRLLSCRVPLLGICAGMEALALVYGGELAVCPEIGMRKVRMTGNDPLFKGIPEFDAYELHSFSCSAPQEFRVLAESDTCVQVIRHRVFPHYGVLFHPEVRNEWVVERFLSILPV